MNINKSTAQLFIDSADADVIDRWLNIGAHGITTNPSIIAKQIKATGHDRDDLKHRLELVHNHLHRIFAKAASVKDRHIPVSVQLTTPDKSKMLIQARAYGEQFVKHLAHLVVKVPFAGTFEGQPTCYLDVMRQLTVEGFRVNATCLMTAEQAILCLMNGARYVSLFVNRIDQERGDPYQEIEVTRHFINEELPNSSEIIAGSIHETVQVEMSWRAGAHIVTVPPPVLSQLGNHHFTVTTTDAMFADAASVGL